MVKKISALALAGLIALPTIASASNGDMQRQIDALTRQLESLKAQMEETTEVVEEKSEKWDLASRIQFSGDFRSRIDNVSADTPAHYEALNVARGVYSFTSAQPALATMAAAYVDIADMMANLGPMMPDLATWITNTAGSFTTAQATALFYMMNDPEVNAMLTAWGAYPTTALTDAMANAQGLVGIMKNLSAGARASIFSNMGYDPTAAQTYKNDTMWTNRFRMNIRAKAMENVEFKGRLAMYKAWGMQSNPADSSYNNGLGGGPFALSGYKTGFDGASTRQPSDNILRVDRAIVNWNNIGGQPVWFSIGRRPTSDGPPAHLRMGEDKRLATPAAVMDYPFDGLTLGYAYQNLFGLTDAPGRIRFCYGRGFEAGPDSDNNNTTNDVDFAGIAWDIYKKDDRFVYLQSYGAFNIFNVPDGVTFANPLEYAAWEVDNTNYDPLDSTQDLILNRANLGDIYHTTALFMDKFQGLNYFVNGSWSKTNARGMDELGTSLLGEWWETPTDRDGYLVYAGVRYDMPEHGLKLGLEYNWGSEYWISFTPGHDDLTQSKLATRGDVVEVYGIWDIPGGEAISKFGKAFMRLGYQHYEYDYTGSGFWLGAPHKIEDLQNDPLTAQFYTPVDSMDQVYLSLEAHF
jgi:hypothetical protein